MTLDQSKEEAEGLVKLGEIAYFTTKYEEFGNGKVKAKALDDRVGCALAIRLLRKKSPSPSSLLSPCRKRSASGAPVWPLTRLSRIWP